MLKLFAHLLVLSFFALILMCIITDKTKDDVTTVHGSWENRGNTEVMETVIFVECREFAKMPCFAMF